MYRSMLGVGVVLLILMAGCTGPSEDGEKVESVYGISGGIVETPEPACVEGEVKTATCTDGVTTYDYANCAGGEWVVIKYLRDPCAPAQQPKEVELPESIEGNCIGFLIGDPREARTVPLAGGAWARPHPGPFAWQWLEPEEGSFSFHEADRWVQAAQANGVALLGTIWPYADWDQKTCHDASCEVSMEDQFYPFGPGGIPKSRCVPCDMEAYGNFLKTLVERYDGDGVEDMPGLEVPVMYWEILNEPELGESFLTFFKGTEEEYVEILKVSYHAIKEACPQCKVVQGGAAGSGDTLEYWGRVFDLGGGEYFDIANIHYISHWDKDTLNVRDFKALMDEKGVEKPIWVTEAELPTEEDAAKSFQGAIEAGASKVFFVSFTPGDMGPPAPGRYSPVFGGLSSRCPG
jgi:hypothetical protein